MILRRSPFLLVVPALLAVRLAAADIAPAPMDPAPTPAPTSAPSADPATVAKVSAAVSAVQAFYDRSKTFSSDFEQRFFVKAHNLTKTQHGHVTFSKPGKMNWVYAEPAGNRVVSDGVDLKVYEAPGKQMYEQQVDKSQYPAALSFLTGSGKLADSFDFEIASGEKMSFPGGFVLIGVPKVPAATYAKVLFYVDQQTSQIRRVIIIDGQGNRNRFDFVSPHINEPVKEGEFNFTPPAGTSVIHP